MHKYLYLTFIKKLNSLFSFLLHLVSPGGKIHYSEVKVFLTKEESVTSAYRSVTTLTNKTIQLSSNHLLYTRRSSSEKFAPMQVYNY